MNDINIQYEAQKINEILKPLCENKKTLDQISFDFKKYFGKYKEIFSENAYYILWEPVKSEIEKKIEVNKLIAEKDAKIALETINELNTSLKNISTTGLGFSLITNSTAHALAYTALNHLENQRQVYEQTKAIYDNALKKLQSLSTGLIQYTGGIKMALEEALYIIVLLEKYQCIFQENKKFCPDIFKHSYTYISDILSEKGKLSSCLADSYANGEFVINSWRFKKEEIYKLETEGYIRIFFDDKYFVSTGKLELELWQDKYWKEHRNEKEEFDKYVLNNKKTFYERAEQELAQNRYYEAAVDFAKADDYNDALKRSIAIWNEYLLDLDIPTVFPEKLKNFKFENCRCKKFKKIMFGNFVGDPVVALGEDGRIYSNKSALKVTFGSDPSEYKEWTDIVDFWTNFSNKIVGIKNDGTVIVEGFKLDEKAVAGKKFIRAYNKCALTDTGDIVFLVGRSDYLSDEDNWLKFACSQLHGVVNVFEFNYYERRYLYAITADGRIHPLGFDDNILCIENVVNISPRMGWGDQLLGIVTSDGQVLEYNATKHTSEMRSEGLFKNVNKLPMITGYSIKEYRKKFKKLKSCFKSSIKRK